MIMATFISRLISYIQGAQKSKAKQNALGQFKCKHIKIHSLNVTLSSFQCPSMLVKYAG